MEDTLDADLRDSAVRAKLGIPLRIAAQLAGVDRRTLSMYEKGAQFVGEVTGAKCEKLFRLLRIVLKEMPGKRAR